MNLPNISNIDAVITANEAVKQITQLRDTLNLVHDRLGTEPTGYGITDKLYTIGVSNAKFDILESKLNEIHDLLNEYAILATEHGQKLYKEYSKKGQNKAYHSKTI